ncbi:zinc finger protein CONSTANS-LIKE 13 [Euphorbia lathyris]|uniref:zinc finger protein CONSTANS-LIKE 13 n=1 Tax=Euphorbia lathyris TaxID=212925 RepID=UPI0033140406
MTDSSTLRQTMKPQRLCDYCNQSVALLYCRADSARLCISCDRDVHSTNQLFSKHTRSLLCDGCHSSPASIFCQTHHSVFCQNCDWETHNFSLSNPVHNRRPIDGFTACPSATDLLTILGFEDLGDKKSLFFTEDPNAFAHSALDDSSFTDGCLDLLLWQTPTISSFDDLIVSTDTPENYQALGVPPLPKNRNAICGQHEEEVLHQLRKLARSEPDSNFETLDKEPVNMFRPSAAEQNMRPRDIYTGYDSDLAPISLPTYEDNIFHWLNDPGEAGNQACHASTLTRKDLDGSPIVPDKLSNIDSLSHANGSQELEAQYLVPTAALPLYPKVGLHDINSQERDSAISRYKEKKKSRRYDKHIRYVSRKVRAESRTRIKGRFAKMDR